MQGSGWAGWLARWPRSFACALFLLTSAVAARALAHPLVDAGIKQADEAAFEDALASFEAAWRAGRLTREEVVTILAYRAVVNFALRASSSVERDLLFLAAIDRSYRFAAHVPPPMVEQFEQILARTRAPKASVAASFAAGNATLKLELEDMPEGLVSDVRVVARPVGAGEWYANYGTRAELPNPRDEAIEWYAEVLGPGGAVILSEGHAAAPRRSLKPAVLKSSAPLAAERSAHDVRGSRSWRWWAIGGATAVVAAAAAVAVLVTRDSTPATQVSPPVLE